MHRSRGELNGVGACVEVQRTRTDRLPLARCLGNIDITITEVARQVGYSSASTLSVAFARHVGMPPIQYAREQRNAQPRTTEDASSSVDRR